MGDSNIKMKRYYDDEILVKMKTFYKKFNRLPTYKDTVNNRRFLFEYKSVWRRYGSWRRALAMAGLLDIREQKKIKHESEYRKIENNLRREMIATRRAA